MAPIRTLYRLFRYRAEWKKHWREISIRRNQRRILHTYPRKLEEVIVFLVPGASYASGRESISGGVISIFSLWEESRKLHDEHKAGVFVATFPGEHLLLRYTNFENDAIVFNLEQLLTYFKAPKYLIHIPELYVANFVNKLPRDLDKRLRGINVHCNILNQNILLMPDTNTIRMLANKYDACTITTAHSKYCNSELRKEFGVPLHKLSVWISAELYKPANFAEKERLILVSPDDHPVKQRLLAKLTELFDYDIQVIRDLKYTDYLKLQTKAKFTLTLGEGLDAYFIEGVFSGAIGITVYNEHFFPPDFSNCPGIFSNPEELITNILQFVRECEKQDSFDGHHMAQFERCNREYNSSRYRKNLELFYSGNYTFP
ncbi:MAG: hypothetical protein H6606_06880 [Flavobacteriales bacterium]|nr:hypothetical protein [Flavobacteriales bacterium]